MNLNDRMKSLSMQFQQERAIKHKASTVLPEILNMLTKTELSELASDYFVTGRSKMNKSQLAAAISETIVRPDNLVSGLLLLDDKEWDLLLTYSKGRGPAADKVHYGSYAFAKDRGWLFAFYSEDRLSIVMSDEVRVALTQIDLRKVNSERQQYRLVIDYIQALVQLYGVIPISEVYRIIQLQNPDQITESAFRTVISRLPQRQRHFDLHHDLFVDGSIESEEEIESLMERAKGKPQYLPPKEQLMLYKDTDYFEMTPQLQALQSYIAKHLCHNAEMVSYLIDDIQLVCSMEGSLKDIIFEFERRGIEFQTIQQAQEVVGLITDVMNNTRLWPNRGHTPLEIRKLAGESTPMASKGAPFRVIVNQQAASVKIGRNDPCTCGSGKKYKKCCGSA